MDSDKRKDVDGEPDGDGIVKKRKMEGDTMRLPSIQGPDDASIRILFDALFYDINTFVQTYFKGSPYVIPRKADQKDFFDSLTGSDYTDYLKLKHPGAKEAMIQAVIWNKLIDSLLKYPTKAFMDDIPEIRFKNRAAAAGALEEFYSWRSMTAHFLWNKKPVSWGEDGPKREEFVDQTGELLLPLSVVEELDKLESGLEGIVDKAFELATSMARSRAGWVCAMKDPEIRELHSFKIKKNRMEEEELWNEDEHSKTIMVDLVKAPMLLKFGNSSGEKYDQHQVVKKAQVVMKAKEGIE